MSDLFEQIAQVWKGSKEITTKTKPESAYMTTRFISLDESGFFAAHLLNSKGTVPEWMILPYLKYMTPNRTPPRNAYPKKETDKLNKKEKKTLARICQKFNVDETHGMQIQKLLEEQGFEFKEN